jgi:hypothetical protein
MGHSNDRGRQLGEELDRMIADERLAPDLKPTCIELMAMFRPRAVGTMDDLLSYYLNPADERRRGDDEPDER